MWKKQLEHGIMGMIAGIVIGALAGLGELQFVNKSQRSAVMPYAIGISAVFGAFIGYGIGSKIGKNIYIEETLGITNTQDNFYKDGRFWVGTTTWKDTRDGKEYKLVTRRSGTGILTTFLNNQAIVNHDIPNANQQTVPKHHQLARNSLFKNLKETFVDKIG